MNRATLLCIALALATLGCDRGDARPAATAHPTPAAAIRPEPRRSPSPRNSGPTGGGEIADAISPEPRDLSAERILLQLPRGPLIVELRITIDGHPFRAPRDELVDELLKAADRDGDGRPTWGEVFADPKRIFGRRLTQPVHMSDRKEFMKVNDTNRNGLIDREEARRFIRQVKASEAAFLLVDATENGLPDARRSLVRALLDTNADDVLDRGELAALEQRLLGRDADDDHIVSLAELDDSLAGDDLALARRGAVQRADFPALLLGPNTDSKLDRIGPQAVVSAAFGKTDKLRPKLSLVDFSAEGDSMHSPLSHAPGSVVLSSAGCRVRFVLDDRAALGRPSPPVDGQSAAPPSATSLSTIYAEVRDEKDILLSLLDSDHDHRLTMRELRGGTAVLREVDADGDGRLTPEEFPMALVIVLGRGRPPESAPAAEAVAVAATPADRPNWFQRMDVNGDREISRDEFPGTSAKFRSLDLDGDGFIIANEAQQARSAAEPSSSLW